MDSIYVLRWGHRPRDFRVTTHVALTARAFKTQGFILSDVEDKTVKRSVINTVKRWGGSFQFIMGVPWRKTVKEWRSEKGFVVHLTMYGLTLNNKLLSDIRVRAGNLLLLVGGRKVPSDFFTPEISDYNIAIGNQPHSEVAALAVFLDRLLEGRELIGEFDKAKFKVISTERGKHVHHNKELSRRNLKV